MAELLGSKNRVIAALLNPRNAATAAAARDLNNAAQVLGLSLHLSYAGEEEEFDLRFAEMTRLGAVGLMISGDPFFNSRAERLGMLSLKHGLPTIFQTHTFTAAGGLISYGTNFPELYRLVGGYTGRVLKGERPTDLPVQQPTKFELIINLRTARSLGLDVPPMLLARANEVIE